MVTSVAVTLPSEVIILEEEAPPLSFVWDSETKRDFARLVGPDVSGGTPPLVKGTS